MSAMPARKPFTTADTPEQPLSVVKPEQRYTFKYQLHSGPNGNRTREFTRTELIDFLLMTQNIKFLGLWEVEEE